MKKDCGFYTAKYLLCCINFIFLVLGTIVLAIAIWLKIDRASLLALFNMMESEQLKNSPGSFVSEQIGIALIVLGAVLIVMSFLGCFGAVRDSRCLLALYGTLSILFFLAEIVIISLAYFYKDEVRDYTKSFLRESMLTYYSTRDQTDVMTRLWNNLMSFFSCCGVDNYNDLAKSNWWMEHKGDRIIPESCCILRNFDDLIPRDSTCVTEPNENNSYFSTGCYDSITSWLINRRVILFCIFLGIDIGVFFCAFLAFILCKSAGRIKRLRL